MHWEWDPELLAVGHAAGLRAIGREPRARAHGAVPRRTCRCCGCPGTLEERRVPGARARSCSRKWGSRSTDEELDRFLEAEHAAWQPARLLASTTHALLEALREPRAQARARLERVRPACAPPPRPRAAGDRGAARRRRVLVRGGLAQAASGDLRAGARGARRRSGGATLFVGDTLADDIAGAAAVGMHDVPGAVVPGRRRSGGGRAGLPGVHADGRPDGGQAPVVSGDSVAARRKRPKSQDLRGAERRRTQ